MTGERGAAGQSWGYGAILFSVLFVLAACLAYIGPRGLPLLLVAGSLASAPLLRNRREVWPGLGLMLGVVVLSTVSLAWSPMGRGFDPTNLERFAAFKQLLQIVVYGSLAMIALRLDPLQAERASLVFAFAAVGLAIALIVEGLEGALAYQAFNRLIGVTQRPDLAVVNVAMGTYILAALAWPAGLILRREGRNVLALLLVGAVIAGMFALGADAPAAALLAGAVAYGLVMLFGKGGVLAVGGMVGGFWLAAPWVVLGLEAAGWIDRFKSVLPASWDARLDIWTFASHRIAEKPLLGWGIDASRFFVGHIPLHTHNAALQYWLELGLPGAVLAAAFWGWLSWTIARAMDDRAWAAAATATLVTVTGISLLSFSAWEEWWISGAMLGLLGCILLKRFWTAQPDVFAPSN